MSQENLEVVRKVSDAAARRDTAAIFDLYDPVYRPRRTVLRFVLRSRYGSRALGGRNDS